MSRPLLVLRPEPGATATRVRIEAAGLTARVLPLFAVRAVAWTPPPPAAFDALLLTSANAVRHAGPGLAAYAALPVVTVGAATAAAAREAGLTVAAAGTGDASEAAALARARGYARLLRLGGREVTAVDGVTDRCVYASEAADVPPGALGIADGAVALLHSPRAAARFGSLLDRDGLPRAGVRIAALSPAVLAAAGGGWECAQAAGAPTDAALVALATMLAIDR